MDPGSTLPPQEEEFPVAIVHPDGGYLTTTYNALKASPNVKLLQWGRLTITTAAANDARPQNFVHYLNEEDSSLQKKARIRCEAIRPTEIKDGVLIFQRLFAGSIRVGTFMRAINQGPVIEIENGRTSHLDRKTGLNAVTGKITIPRAASADRRLIYLRLRPDPPDRQEIPFTLEPAGDFRIDGVPPGRYQSIAVFLRSLPTRSQAKADVLGAIQYQFDLAPESGDFDVGTLFAKSAI